MLFTLRKPKSQRFFQLSFEGFKPKGRNWLEKLINGLLEYILAIQLYLKLKLTSFINLLIKSLFLSKDFILDSKSLLVRKLIWSRGRLGRPISTAFIMSFAFLIFIFGEVFNSSKFVNNQEVQIDYIASNNPIIPNKNIAITTIPESRKKNESFNYVVEGGDTLFTIGNKFKISVAAIRYVNNLTDESVLKPGQSLVIPPVTGLIHKVQRGDNIESIARKYSVASQSIADFNYIIDISRLTIGTELIIPDAKVPEVPKPVIVVNPGTTPSASGSTGSGGAKADKSFCVWPTSVRIVTQDFSWRHDGLDIATPWGGTMPPIYSCTGGKVIRAGWDPWGLGLHVRVDHGGGYETVYGHMSRIDVAFGNQVKRGQVLGLMGNTGRSSGPHVHYMVKYNGVVQNPWNYTR